MKNHIVYILTGLIIFTYSCRTSKMDLNIPEDLYTSQNIIHVKGTKGKGLVGTKRKLVFDKIYVGKLKEGWTISSATVDKTPGGFFSKIAWERSLYKNIGVDIDDITSKKSDKFQFTISDSSETILGLCKQKYISKSTNYNIKDRIDISKGKSHQSNFSATFVSSDTLKKNWSLELKFDRDTPNGFIQMLITEGMAVETGHLTNQTDTIFIKPLFIKGSGKVHKQSEAPIKIVGGYEFTIHGRTLGMVDLYNQNIRFVDLKSKYNSIINAGAISLLLRNR